MPSIQLGKALPPETGLLSVGADILHHNSLILGTNGSGKTELIKNLIDQLLPCGTNTIAIDTTGDLTQRFVERPNASVKVQVLDLGLASGLLSYETKDHERAREQTHNLLGPFLGLMGFRSRKFSPEFAFLEVLADHQRSAGQRLELKDLPRLVLHPPFSKLGVYHVEQVMPQDRRSDLAAAISSLLDTPSFSRSSTKNLQFEELLSSDGAPTAWVLSFADRAPRIRQFLLAILLASLTDRLPTGSGEPKLFLCLDEASDFLPPHTQTLSSAMLLKALDAWSTLDASVGLVAQQLSEIHDDVDNLCETWFVGQVPAAPARHDIVAALDLVNPPVDEEALEAQVKSLRTGQFVLRSPRLEKLKTFQIDR